MKINCAQLDDPSVQLGLVLHNSQTANEVFLLSLRDCVVTMPSTHPLKRWLQSQSAIKSSDTARMILTKLEGELKGIWAADHALTATQRKILIRFLDDLEELPPYLDYFLLRAVGYLKLGNWARTEKLLVDWLNMDLIERISQSPRRNDPLAKHTSGLAATLFETLGKGLRNHIVVDFFFQSVREFYSTQEIVSAAQDNQDLEESDIITKLGLRYYQVLVPGFSGWILNREWGERKRARFLETFFNQSDVDSRLWIFMGQIPHEAKNREALAKRLGPVKASHPLLFHSLAQEDGLQGVLIRVAPEQMRNLIKERRSLLRTRFEQDRRNAWVLKGLVELGQIDAHLVQAMATP